MDNLPFDRKEIEGSISARFERVVKKFPHKIAVKSGGNILTYEELDAASDQVAQAIISSQGENPEPVAFFLKQRMPAVIAIMGILRAGKCYIPLDIALPAAKIIDIVKSTRTNLIIINKQDTACILEWAETGCRIISMDEISGSFSKKSSSMPALPGDLAAVFYTSGSTGEPKGVKWNHRSVLHASFVNVRRFPVGPEDHHSLNFSCSAAASVASIFGALLAGASLHLYDPAQGGINELVSWVKNESITILYSPVSLFRQLLYNIEDETYFPALRMVIVGGQPLYRHDITRFTKKFSKNCILVNRLALSEAGGLTYFFIDNQTELSGNVAPVGYPLEGKEVFLLDKSGNRVAEGENGEIAVRSRFLSPGYWHNSELTAEKFLPDPEGGDKRICLTGDMGKMLPDGCLVHIGRKDFVVKIRGYRVEIGAVETILHSLDSVKENVVVAHEDKNSGEKRLVAYLVSAADPAPTAVELRKGLETTLPSYMIPSVFVFLEKMPQTHTGKVDRNALPEPGGSRVDLGTVYAAPRLTTEKKLAGIWGEVLGVREVGIHDDFFVLGGDSLQLMSIYTHIEKTFGIIISGTEIAQCNTVERMAQYINGEKIYERFWEDRLERSSFEKPKQSDLFEYFKSRVLTFLGFALPYSIGSKLLSTFFSQTWIRFLFFKREVTLICQFLKSINNSCKEKDLLVKQSLTSNFWEGWRHVALSKTSNKVFQQWVTVKDLSVLNKLHKREHGVILISAHTTMMSLIFLLLDRLGVEDTMFVGEGGKLMMNLMGVSNRSSEKFLNSSLYNPLNDDMQRLYLRSTELYGAKKVLKRGGIVTIVPDGYVGKSGLELSFLGRRRRFAAGFAELAVETGATVIPVVSSMNYKGRIAVEFHTSLYDRSSDAGSRKSGYAGMIEQYVKLLEKKWREDPGSITLSHVKRFLELPLAEKPDRLH